MRLTNSQINDILKEYKPYITGVSYKYINIKNTKRIFSVPIEDLIQEIMIQMYYLLRDRYDSEIGNIERFIKGFLFTTIKGVLSRVSTSLKETGTSTNRTQLIEIKKNVLSIEFLNSKENRKIKGEALISSSNNQQFTDSDYNLGMLLQAGDTNIIDAQLDRKVIINEIKNRLNNKTYATFKYVFLFGYNFADTAKITGNHPSTISKQVRGKIIVAIKEALIECGYL